MSATSSVRYSRKQFEGWAEDALDSIPDSIHERLGNLVVVVEDEPTDEQLKKAGVPPGETLLGLYEGVPLIQRSWFEPMSLPARVTLFQGPLEDCSEGHIRQELYETLWHELAHHIGMTEEEVQEAERRKFG